MSKVCENHGRRRSHLSLQLERQYLVDGEFHDDDGGELVISGPARCDECYRLMEEPSEEWLTVMRMLRIEEESKVYGRYARTYSPADIRRDHKRRYFGRGARFVLLAT